MDSASRLRLASRRDVERRVVELLDFYRSEYGSCVFIGERSYTPHNLYFSQSYVESDKLGLVLKAVLFNGYRVPIIVVVGDKATQYVVDGHHRSIVYAWLGWRIPGLTIIVPKYKPRLMKTILDLELLNPPDTPSELACWRHIVNTVRFLEKQHGLYARIWLESIDIGKLKPTEPPIISPRPHPTSLHCPILVYKYGEDYYVVDGHHRVCLKLLEHSESIPALVFTIGGREIGLIRTARRINQREFNASYCSSI